MFKSGDRFRVNIVRYNDVKVGETILIATRPYNNGRDGFYAVRDGMQHNTAAGNEPYYFNTADMVPATRKELAKWMKEEGTKMVDDGTKMLNKAEMLEKYETDEEEVAATLVAIMTTEGKPEEKVTKIAKLLKGRVNTNLV